MVGAMMKTVLRLLLAGFMMFAGVAHFGNPDFFVRMVPAFLPDPLMVTWVSGVFECVLGVMLLVPRTRWYASLGLVALYLAVLPANINMALHPTETGAPDVASWLLWARLPFQLVFIGWAVWVGGPRPKTVAR